jgi:hypothetical protein
MSKTKLGPEPEEAPAPVEEPTPEGDEPAPVNEDESLAWHPSFRSMLDHPAHPLHHLRNA